MGGGGRRRPREAEGTRSELFHRTRRNRQRNRAIPARRLPSGKGITVEDSTPDFEALYEYIVCNGPEVFTPLIRAEEDQEKRYFYYSLQDYSLQQKQRVIIADENFVV